MYDIFDAYEIGLRKLSKKVDVAQQPEFAVLNTRLKENIGHTRLFGDTETRRAERAMIIDSLNRMVSKSTNGLNFLDLCELESETKAKQNDSDHKDQILCLLFSDLKGYSDLRDDRLKNQIVQEMKTIAESSSQSAVQLVKTMGDGLMMSSFIPLPLAETALHIRDAFRTTNWRTKGYPEDFYIRIGVHLDQVTIYYRGDGMIQDAIGQAVDTTARIEPITTLNSVFCSKYFFDLLLNRGIGKIKGISLGKRMLAKQFGEMELYELRWSHESDE